MADFDRESISQMRKSYGEKGLTESDAGGDPIELFLSWLSDAAQNPLIVEANAMVLSTIHDQSPISRTVLLKDITTQGLTFFTNYSSRKGRDIESNPEVSLLFPWYPMERQVIITGRATRVSAEESDKYFASRPWSSQIGAWASEQSQSLDSRQTLEKRWAEYSTRYPEGSEVPRPVHWGGYRVTPHTFEFWQGRYSRLHDRIRYTNISHGWEIERLFP
ncbi:MAG: pyridoxamine 5'-phosphate oxidase [Actinobacteria bacterium]|jgi:pyridoxamine 5'-phosphate oxidase|nr:pyridoxamine 5'-phosphate oxidase [Actinomycetota bacterium]